MGTFTSDTGGYEPEGDDDFTPNTIMLSDKVDANFDKLKSHLDSAFVDDTIINDASISGSKLIDGTVDGAKLAGGTVPGGSLVAGSVGTTELADDSVTNDKLSNAPAAVQDNVIDDNTISGVKLTDSTIGIGKLNFTIPTGTVGQLPAGAMIWHSGTVVPPQFFLMDGQELDYTVYSILASAYGHTGADNTGFYDNHPTLGLPAAGNFRVPDLMGRAAIGPDGGTGRVSANNTLGDSSGAEDHVLLTAELAQHAHTLNDTGHAHGITDNGHGHGLLDPGHDHFPSNSAGFVTGPNESGTNLTSGSGSGTYAGTSAAPGGNTTTELTGISVVGSATGISVDPAFTGVSVNNEGSNTAHNNMQPYLVLLPCVYSGL